MSFRNRVSRLADYMSGLRACAVAAESGRRPDDRALRAIGIDPELMRDVKFR
jgi:hypothetical protein